MTIVRGGLIYQERRFLLPLRSDKDSLHPAADLNHRRLRNRANVPLGAFLTRKKESDFAPIAGLTSVSVHVANRAVRVAAIQIG